MGSIASSESSPALRGCDAPNVHRTHCRRSRCAFCPGGSIEWSIDATPAPLAATADDVNRYPASASPAARRVEVENAVVERGIEALQRVHGYLRKVYPAGRWGNSSASDCVELFTTRTWLYHGGGVNVPWDLLEPSMFPRVRRVRAAAVRCSGNSGGDGNGGGSAFHGVAHLGYQRLYRDLVSCRLGADCTRRLAAHRPQWAKQLEARRDGAYLEVTRFARSTMQSGVPPTSWSEFLDEGESGWWYHVQPGSGVFYHVGASLVEPTKTSMLVRLLEQWLDGGSALAAGHVRLADQLRDSTSGDPASFVGKLRLVRAGEKTCAQVGLSHVCYQRQHGYDASYTVYDTYDRLMIMLGRALGYSTLIFSASFLRPDIADAHVEPPLYRLARPSLAELVDLRLPAWARSKAEPDGTAAWLRLSRKERSRAWVADVRKRGVLSLRDPLAPSRPGLPCRFHIAPMLACEEHVSWPLRNASLQQIAGNGQCLVPARTVGNS